MGFVSNDATIWHELGIFYIEQKDYEKAIQAYQNAINIDQNFAALWSELGYVYQNLKEYKKAIQAYQNAIELDPNNAIFWNNLGMYYRGQKDYEKAIQTFQNAIKVDQNYAYPWNGLGIVYDDLKEYKKAIKAFQGAIKLNPNFAFPWNGLGIVYDNLKEYKKAIEAYKNAINIDPNFAAPWNGLGVVYDNLKEYKKAIEAYQNAINIDQNFAAHWNGLGSVYNDLKQYEKAIHAYKNAINLDQNDTLPWNGLGNVYNDLKQYEKAIEAYKNAINIDQNFASPWHGLGNVYFYLKEYEKAIEAYQKAIQLDQNSANPWNGLGNVYGKLKEYEKAIEAYQNAINIDQNYALPHYRLGDTYLKTGETTLAIRYLLKSEKLDYPIKRNYFIDFSTLLSLPFFNYRLFEQYLPPEDYSSFSTFLQITLEQALPLKIYLYYLEISGKTAAIAPIDWLRFLGIINYFMRDYLKAYDYFENIIKEHNSKDLIAYYYLIQSGHHFLEYTDDYLDTALAIAEELLENKEKQSFLSLYYAGQIFAGDDEWIQAAACFEYIENNFLPAKYMLMWVYHQQGKKDLTNQLVTQIKEKELAKRQYSQHIQATLVDLEEKYFIKPFYNFGYYFEIAEAIALFHDKTALDNSIKVEHPNQQAPYYKLWGIKKEDIQRIVSLHRSKINKEVFDTFYKTDLSKIAVKPENAEEISSKISKAEDTDLNQLFQYLKQVSQKKNFAEEIGAAIRKQQFPKNYYHLLNAYFHYNKQIAPYNRLLLDFYVLIQEMPENPNTQSFLRGIRKAIEQSIGKSLDKISIAVLTGLGLITFFPTTVTGVAASAASVVLADLLLNYWRQKTDKTPPSFQAFKSNFEQFIGEEIDRLGRDVFYRKYPIQEIYKDLK